MIVVENTQSTLRWSLLRRTPEEANNTYMKMLNTEAILAPAPVRAARSSNNPAGSGLSPARHFYYYLLSDDQARG